MSSPVSYPPKKSAVLPGLDYPLGPVWTEALETRIRDDYSRFEIEKFELLPKLRLTLQFHFCELHRKKTLSFYDLCCHMVRLERIFRDIASMGKDCVFTAYLAHGPDLGDVPATIAAAVRAIQRNIPPDIIEGGYQQGVMRQLLIHTAHKVKSERDATMPRRSAAKLTLFLLDNSGKDPIVLDDDGLTKNVIELIIDILRHRN